MEKKKSNRYEKDRELLGRQGVDLSKLDALEESGIYIKAGHV